MIIVSYSISIEDDLSVTLTVGLQPGTDASENAVSPSDLVEIHGLELSDTEPSWPECASAIWAFDDILIPSPNG